jgi:hypothetical protein
MLLMVWMAGLFVFGIVVYLSGSIPALRTVVNPEAGIDNPSDQVQALQLVSAGNIINLVICAFIFTLQVSILSVAERSVF